MKNAILKHSLVQLLKGLYTKDEHIDECSSLEKIAFEYECFYSSVLLWDYRDYTVKLFTIPAGTDSYILK